MASQPSRRLAKRAALLIATTAAVALAVTGIAVGLSGTTTSGVFSACLNSKTGVLASVTVAPTTPIACPKGTTAVSWNAQGPTGAPGPSGAPGSPGATGATGPSGADGATILNGPGTPATDLGKVGDLYLDTTAYALYGPKTADGWGTAHVLGSNPMPTPDPTPTASPTDSPTCADFVVPANARAVCDNGQAVIVGCNYPYADADGVYSNGCEANLLLDPNNCGRVGVVATAPNAVAGCRNGSVFIISCNPGYYDLNGLVADGCEYSGPLPSTTPTP